MFCDMYLSGCWKEMNEGFPRRCQIQGEAAKATVDFFYSAKQDDYFCIIMLYI